MTQIRTTARRRLAGTIALLPLAIACAAGGATAAKAAPDYPDVVSPLRVQTDDHGLNVITGKIELPTPTLSVPAAPNLRFDRVQNAAPYVKGTLTWSSDAINGSSPATQSYSVHAGTGASDSFKCLEGDCSDNVMTNGTATGTGSRFIGFNTRLYTQAGTGAQWTFDLKYAETTQPGTSLSPGHTSIQYYASHANYPNGETISYAYDSYAPPGDYANRTFYRPTRVTSSMGYYITIAYQSDDFSSMGWQTVREAALYAAADPANPLGRLTYSGDTITDLLGRTFTCTGCQNALGVNIETMGGSLQLPGESAAAETVSPNASANNELVSAIVKDGVAWTYAYTNLRYDANSLVWLYDKLTVTGPNGYSMAYTLTESGQTLYDRHNELTAIADGLGRTTAITNDARSRPVRQVLPEGNEVDTGYDDYGNVVSKVTKAKPGSGLPDLSETAYLDATNCESTGTVVSCYRPVWSRDALGRQTDYVYNGAGQLTEQSDPADQNGVRRKTYVLYDTSSGISRRSVVRVCGDVTTCGTANEIRTEYTYWGATLLPATETRVDGASGVRLTTTYTYDNAGRPLAVDGPLPGSDDAVYYRYDAVGRKTWEIGPKGANGLRAAKRFTYRPADDKVIAVETGTVDGAVDAASPAVPAMTVLTRVDTAYDGRRNPVREAVSGSDGLVYGVTERSFDDRGQLLCQAQRMNAAAFGSATDGCTLGAEGSFGPDRITHNLYDPAGQLTQVQKAYATPLQQNYASYEYTLNGKQKAVTDANGNRAEMVYDGYDRQRRWTFPSATTAGVANAGDYEEYGYDAVGNRTSLRKRDGVTLTYAYDGMNRMTQKTVPASATGAAGYGVAYNYDVNGLQTSARFGSASGPGIATTYDGFGRIASTTTTMDGTARTLGYLYDAQGNRTHLSASSGSQLGWTYDAAGAMTAVLDGTNPIVQIAYDPAGRRQGLTMTQGGTSGVSYGYDSVGRLAALGHDLAGTASDQSFGFGYSPASQIVTRSASNDAYASTSATNTARSYSVNGLNQYSAVAGNAYAYDANGNLTNDGVNAYVYDAENRLVSRSGGVSLAYDPNGRLWQVSGPSGTSRFEYDGDRLIQEYDGAGTRTRLYAHGAGPDEPLAWWENVGGAWQFRFLHADHQGSVIAATDGAGNMLGINAYDAWGVPSSTSIATVGRFGYTGQAWLPELGMYYYKARIYSPMLGRFLQTDSIGYKDQVNLYAYVGNDPIDRRDPTGLAGCGTRLNYDSASCSGSTVIGNIEAEARRSAAARTEKPGDDTQAAASSAVELAAWTSHDYPVGPYFICRDSLACRQAIRAVFPYYIVPNLNQRVSNGQISPVYYSPDFPYIVGHVLTRVSSDGLSATNITLSDHLLRYGQVDIFNRLIGDSWYVGAHGYGSNFPGIGWVNQTFGPEVFQGMLGDYIMVVRSRLRN